MEEGLCDRLETDQPCQVRPAWNKKVEEGLCDRLETDNIFYFPVPTLTVEISQIENALISEIKLTPSQASVYLLVTCNGKMSVKMISDKLSMPVKDASQAANDLMKAGAFISITETEFEAMHPRFTAVNMYRRMCSRENLEFKPNKIVDNIGVFLEKFFDDARTK